jgi:ATP-dependent RNA helicase DeaD
LDIAAALLKMLSSQDSGQTAPVHDTDDIDTGAEEGMVRLFMNIGNKNRIQPRHIVEGIASSTGLPGKLIGAIDIFDDYTFVEVPREYSQEVMTAMKNYTMKGKRINIEKSNKRPKLKRRVKTLL